MKVILNGKHSEESSILALGMFDGVHIGHQVLLERARTLHMRWGAPLVVCTFARHPMELIAPERADPAHQRQCLPPRAGKFLSAGRRTRADLVDHPLALGSRAFLPRHPSARRNGIRIRRVWDSMPVKLLHRSGSPFRSKDFVSAQ